LRSPSLPRRRLIGAGLAALSGLLARRQDDAEAAGERPIALAIAAIDIVARVEVLTTVDGKMQDPTTPWIVAWYDDSAPPGTGSNAVFAGHVSTPEGEPAIFARLGELRRGDEVIVLCRGGKRYRYRVMWARAYSAERSATWVELTGPTDGEVVTLITCAGAWDAAAGTYRERLVVRAALVTTPEPGEVPARPRGSAEGEGGTG